VRRGGGAAGCSVRRRRPLRPKPQRRQRAAHRATTCTVSNTLSAPAANSRVAAARRRCARGVRRRCARAAASRSQRQAGAAARGRLRRRLCHVARQLVPLSSRAPPFPRRLSPLA
jgi:hypothetical protein